MSLSKLSNRRTVRQPLESAGPDQHQRHWVEIFTARVTERLKEILQEDMDWMTSRPILDRLNRLHDIEEARAPKPDRPDTIPSNGSPETRK